MSTSLKKNVIKCPHCKQATSKLSKKCVHCNRAVQSVKTRDAHVPIKCPTCEITTHIITLADLELDHCSNCNGIWFDKGEVLKFQKALSQPVVYKKIITALNELKSSQPKSTRTAYLNCSVCSEPMLHNVFLNSSGIMLDSCSSHGTWVERDDLTKILELFDTGKIDELIQKSAYAKQVKLEKRLRQLEDTQDSMNSELKRTQSFSRIHFILDALGFL